tara:strand:- start:128 stop:355 length:228 start_codon:yes stop_codon:yes gene_type:complete
MAERGGIRTPDRFNPMLVFKTNHPVEDHISPSNIPLSYAIPSSLTAGGNNEVANCLCQTKKHTQGMPQAARHNHC